MLDDKKYAALKATGALPSPKGAALKIIELCQRSNVSLTEIIRVIQADPGLMGRLLKLANSPTFARQRPAVSLTPDVLMTIGLQSLRQVVLAFSLISSNRNGFCRNFDYDGFWSQSVAMGVAAQLLGGVVRVVPPMELFTCGLLAQIGQLGLSSVYPERYSELLSQLCNQPEAAVATLEEQAFGLTHTQVAAAMMADWSIPKLFTDAVLFHEAPLVANLPEDSRSARLVWCLHLAKQLAAFCSMDDVQRAMQLPRLFSAGQKLGIAADKLVALGDQMLIEWKDWSGLLELATYKVSPFTMLEVEVNGVMESAAHVGLLEDESLAQTILVVDDDPTILLLLKRLLINEGYTVITAKNGKEALSAVLELKPQILIADWMMPEMDGLELVRSLRETEAGRNLYVMMLTARHENESLALAFDAGTDDYIVKPIDPTVLKARLKAGWRFAQVHKKMEHDRMLLQHKAAELTMAQELSLKDELTGLFNHRYAMERLASEWIATERNRLPLSLMILNIDNFSQINESYGFEMGNTALKHFAELLRDTSRSPDVACRMEGDEFLVLASGTTLEGAMHYAERIRVAIQALSISAPSGYLRLTTSIGVAQKSKTTRNFDELLSQANAAVIRAQYEGSNRAIAAS